MDQFLAGLRLATFFGFSGLFFTLGIACACRLLGWAPVNVNVTIYNLPGKKSVVSPGAADE